MSFAIFASTLLQGQERPAPLDPLEQYAVEFTAEEGFVDGLLIRQNPAEPGAWKGSGLKVDAERGVVLWDSSRKNASWNQVVLQPPLALANSDWAEVRLKVDFELNRFSRSFETKGSRRICVLALTTSPKPYDRDAVRFEAALTENDGKLYWSPLTTGVDSDFGRAGIYVRALTEIPEDNVIPIELVLHRDFSTGKVRGMIATRNLRQGRVESPILHVPDIFAGKHLYLALIFGNAEELQGAEVAIDSVRFSVKHL